MDPIVIEVVKYLASFGSSTFVARIWNRKVRREVEVLRVQNATQQGNMDSMQTSQLMLQSQLIRYQDELIVTKNKLADALAELENLRGRVHVFEFKSNEDEVTKRALGEHNAELAARNKELENRVSELEALCVRQEAEIIEHRAVLEHLKEQLGITQQEVEIQNDKDC